MAYAAIKAQLDAGKRILLDGATGTELERRGVPMSTEAWCGPCNLDHADKVEAVHIDYIEAGAAVITANTYAANRLMLTPAGYADHLGQIVGNAVNAAKRARDKAAKGRDIVVAGSLSHMIPIPQGSDRADAEHAPSDETASAAYREMAELITENGCDLIILEMMYTPHRTRMALEAAIATGLPGWCGFSLRRETPDAAICGFAAWEDVPQEDLFALLPETGVDAAGIMHSYPDVVGPGLTTLSQTYKGALMAYPESGHFEMPNWNYEGVMSGEDLVGYARSWVDQGAQIIGGCCGLGIEHIRALGRSGVVV